MAKPRRPLKPVKPSKSKPRATTVAAGPMRASARARAAAGASASPAVPTPRRSTYVEAVALYERGLDALQKHDYSTAADRFEAVLRQYPEEKELHERVRQYLNICHRQASPQRPTPQTVEE